MTHAYLGDSINKALEPGGGVEKRKGQIRLRLSE